MDACLVQNGRLIIFERNSQNRMGGQECSSTFMVQFQYFLEGNSELPDYSFNPFSIFYPQGKFVIFSSNIWCIRSFKFNSFNFMETIGENYDVDLIIVLLLLSIAQKTAMPLPQYWNSGFLCSLQNYVALRSS